LVLGTASKLVRVPPEHDRVIDGRNLRLRRQQPRARHLPGHTERTEPTPAPTPMPMSRFRPNIVIDGWDEPHLEDRAHLIVVANAELGYAKLEIRSAVTLVNQQCGDNALVHSHSLMQALCTVAS
jgi:hypothetical protein